MPDLLFHGGPIYTLDARQVRAEAILVRDETIVAVGSAAEVRAAARPGYEDVPLNGRAVIPGLTDAHIHLLWTAQNRQNVQLDGVASLEAALELIRKRAAQLPDGAWLRGHGWNHALWAHRWPTAEELDRVTDDRPAILWRKDAHSAWVNSRALALAGIDATMSDPGGGAIQRDEQGRPTGILLEGSAIDLVARIVPPPTAAENQQALHEILRECNRRGLTSLHTIGCPAPDGPATLAAIQAAYAAGTLTTRCLFHLPHAQLDEYIGLGVRSGLGDAWVRIGGVKLFSDGSLGSCTCHMLAPFEDSRTNVGMPTLSDEALYAAVRQANDHGIAVTVHAIGDRANRTVLDAIAAYRALGDRREQGIMPPLLPNRIEHAQHLDPADVPRFAELGVIASMQPLHATSDIDIAERLLGPERSAWSYAWRPLQQAGAILAFGSDAPVETFDPWAGIHAAVTRRRRNGEPPNGWNRQLALDLHETLYSYAVGPAIASNEGARKGTLAPGMLADLLVLEADPFAINPHDLWRMNVVQTFVGGRCVWE